MSTLGFSLTYLAGLAGVALRTGAVVLIWLSVHASSSVDTRLVATTVIQIWRRPGGKCTHLETLRYKWANFQIYQLTEAALHESIDLGWTICNIFCNKDFDLCFLTLLPLHLFMHHAPKYAAFPSYLQILWLLFIVWYIISMCVNMQRCWNWIESCCQAVLKTYCCYCGCVVIKLQQTAVLV